MRLKQNQRKNTMMKWTLENKQNLDKNQRRNWRYTNEDKKN
nr:hypothetical protein [Mycoplasmopsis bovis]